MYDMLRYEEDYRKNVKFVCGEVRDRERLMTQLKWADALSTSFLEAMAMGAFPIQSHTACVEEWAEDGKTALRVHPDDPESVAAAIRRAVTDDELVDRAAEINGRTVRERLDQAVIQSQVIAAYNDVASDVARSKKGG